MRDQRRYVQGLRRWQRLVTAALCLALGGVASAARTKRPYTLGPTPGWVDVLPVDLTAPIPADRVREGTYQILADDQIRVSAQSTQHYHRRVQAVVSTSGVQGGSEIQLDFDPSFQRLTIHGFHLVRGGRRLDALEPDDIRIIQQETDLDQRLYDGTLSALVILHDVRPGDVLDYAYSVEGENPILGGRFVDTLHLATASAVHRLRKRLLWPLGRVLHVRNHGTDVAPAIAEARDVRTYVWERTDVPGVDWEDDAPAWQEPYPTVELSEFDSWAAVAGWARALYPTNAEGDRQPTGPEAERQPAAGHADDATPPAIRAVAQGFHDASARDEERALAAIRFVQDDVRYFGIEIGPNSHQPHPPEAVLAQRFGDCKDKALLLVTLLRALGIEAWPALVNTDTRRHLDERLPSPFAFNHVIVLARVGGRDVWIDATADHEGGSLATLEPPGFERALVVRPEETALAAIPLPTRETPTVAVEESYAVPAGPGPTRLHVRTTYRGRDADDMREYLARTSTDDLARDCLNRYAQDDPSIKAVGAPVQKDDRKSDVLVVEEDYQIGEFWTDAKRSFDAWSLGDEVPQPKVARRARPFAQSFPAHTSHRITVRLPKRPDAQPETIRVDDAAFRFRFRSEIAGTTVELSWLWRTLADAVPPDAMKSYIRELAKVREALGYTLYEPDDKVAAAGAAGAAGASDDVASGGDRALLAILGVAATGAVALVWVRRARLVRERRPRRYGEEPAPYRPGEAPASALHVRDPGEMGARIGRERCPCGARIPDREGERRQVRYDRRTMTVVTRSCPRCGKEQTLYFDLAGAGQQA